jgi:hypothetical protein
MITVCIGRMGGLMTGEDVVMCRGRGDYYDDTPPVYGLGAVSAIHMEDFAAWGKFPNGSRPASAMVASNNSPSARLGVELDGEPARCFLEAGASVNDNER